ncbi:MAG TPA: phosphodiester glycosidase family protein [Solirubrobacteraceae bacterium]
MELGAATRPRLGPGSRRTDSRARVSGSVRLRRIALVAAVVILLPAGISFVSAMTQPSNSSFGIRAVEWLRDNGGAGLVAKVESVYYSLTAPSKGGPTLRALPKVGFGTSGGAASAEYRPARVHAMLNPALPGEGVWHATRPGLEGSPPVLLTTLRDQPEYPRVVAGLAWINTKRTHLALHAGRLEPSVELPRGAMEVPHEVRPKLLATFNSGFKLSDSNGGFVLRGHTYAPLRNGQGTLVGYEDGHVDVVDWSSGSRAPAGVSFARQNLPLIVREGRTAPNIGNTSEWGATVGNAVLVWRSGIGVDAHGNLIYAAGENQTVGSLAHALIRAGAVRAMELDINSYWVSFITYGAPGALSPLNMLPAMNRSATRYLEPDDRDFFTISSR